jgi:hypothetical protein
VFACSENRLMSHSCMQTHLPTICGVIHHSLKSLCGVGQPKRGEQIIEQAKWRYDCSFWDVLGRNRDLVMTEKTVQSCRPLERSCMFGKGYLFGVVTKFKWR